MVDVPAECGVISPVDEFIVALAPSDEDHNPPSSVLSKVVVPFEHIVCTPLKVPVLTGAVIVTARVAVAVVEQPPEPVTV